MSDKIGPLQFTSGGGDPFLGRYLQSEQSYSDAIAHDIDTEMQNFINYCYDRAKNILTEHKDKLELIAQTLLEVETLDAKQIKSLFEDGVLPEPETAEEKGEPIEPASDEAKSNTDDDDDDVKVTIKGKEDNKPETFEEAKAKAEAEYQKKKEAEEKAKDEESKSQPEITEDTSSSEDTDKKE